LSKVGVGLDQDLLREGIRIMIQMLIETEAEERVSGAEVGD